jgi:integrase
MGEVYNDKWGLVISVYHKAVRFRKRVLCSEDDAWNMLEEIERDIRLGRFDPAYWFPGSRATRRYHRENPSLDMTLKAVADTWKEEKKADLTKSTYTSYVSMLNKHILPAIGHMRLCEINEKLIRSLRSELRVPSSKTKNNVIAVVESILSENGVRIWVRRLREAKPAIDPFDHAEMDAIVGKVRDPHREFVIVAFETGIRVSEQIALKWSKIDWVHNRIRIDEGRVLGVNGPTKTERSIREIEISPRCLAALKRQKERTFLVGGYVFLNRNAKPLEQNNLRKRVWIPALKRAGVRYREMKNTRHTFASLRLSGGGHYLWVAEQMGDNPITVFKRYAKFVRPGHFSHVLATEGKK